MNTHSIICTEPITQGATFNFSSVNFQNYYQILSVWIYSVSFCLSFTSLHFDLFLSLHLNVFLPHLLFSPLSPSDCMSHLCWPSAFLLLGCLLLDVSGGCATLPHAGGGLWERVLPQKVLLSVRLLLPRTGGGHLRGHRLQELWDQESVRVKTGLLHLQIEQ